MKLKNKVILTQMPLGIILVLLSLFFIVSISQLSSKSSEVLISNYRSMEAFQKMRTLLEGFNSTTWMLINSEYSSRGEILYLIKNLSEDFEQQINIQKENAMIDGELEFTATMEKKWVKYKNDLDHFVDMGLNNVYLSSKLYDSKLRKSYVELRSSINSLTDLNEDDTYYRSQGITEMTSNITKLMAIFTIAFFLLGVLISAFLTNKIMSPLSELTVLAREIASGRVGFMINVTGEDEVSELSHEFNRMVESLEDYKNSSIGELVRAKLFLQVAIDTLPDPLLIVNSIGKVLNLNNMTKKEFDIVDDFDSNFEDALDLIPFVVKERIDEIIKFVYENPVEPIPNNLLRAIMANYNYKITEFVPLVQPVIDDNLNVMAVAIILRNVSNIDVKGYIKAEKFVSLTHELMIPINSIHIAIHACLERAVGELNPKQEDFLSSARNDCFRIKKMITNLQDVDKLEDITQDLEKSELSIVDIITQSAKEMEVIAASKEIKFELELSLILDKIIGNAEQLRLLFNNLFDNAVHHSPIQSSIKVRLIEKDKKVKCLIHNTGSYIPAEYQNRIFDKFFQIPGENSNRDGLGLYIAKKIVEQHGGNIGVKSSKRLGTTFLVEIPKSSEYLKS
jgi:signal transduction histidine kinase